MRIHTVMRNIREVILVEHYPITATSHVLDPQTPLSASFPAASNTNVNADIQFKIHAWKDMESLTQLTHRPSTFCDSNDFRRKRNKVAPDVVNSSGNFNKLFFLDECSWNLQHTSVQCEEAHVTFLLDGEFAFDNLKRFGLTFTQMVLILKSFKTAVKDILSEHSKCYHFE